MSIRTTVIDYGMGNLYSVRRAVEYCGSSQVTVSSDPDCIESADRLILPGVGAFQDGMRGLEERGLVAAITRYARSGRPLLGICLGMQMLVTESEEFGIHAGLNLIPGRTVAIPRTSISGEPLKVPFIGWTPLTVTASRTNLENSLDLYSSAASVYLLHSYHVIPEDQAHILAYYTLGSQHITAAIKKQNVTGFQFHPEKSGRVGLDILQRFMACG